MSRSATSFPADTTMTCGETCSEGQGNETASDCAVVPSPTAQVLSKEIPADTGSALDGRNQHTSRC